MPPAFNLSQDQTPQFDLIAKFNSLDSAVRPLDEKRTAHGRHAAHSHAPPPTALASCEHSSLGTPPPPNSARPEDRAPPGARGPRLSTHTYRLLIVKERLRYMGPLVTVSSGRLPCRAITSGGVYVTEEGKYTTPAHQMQRKLRRLLQQERIPRSRAPHVRARSPMGDKFACCAKFRSTRAFPHRHTLRAAAPRLRLSGFTAGLGYFHLLCTHSQSAGLR
jgi:hypothetical protein